MRLMMVGSMTLLQALPLAAQEGDALLVEVVTARATPVERTFESTGEVVARDALALAFPTSGRVTEVLVEEGARVEAGDPLARMDAMQEEQALRAARAGLATAQANQRKAADDFAREDSLLATGATTRARRDEAERWLNATNAAVVSAQSELETAQSALTDRTLTAPAAGQVVVREVEPGQVVASAQTVIELAAGGGFDALFDVPEALLARADTAPPHVMMSLIEGDHAAFEGRVSEVSPQIDPETGTVQVTVAIDGTPDGVSYGDAVKGSVTVTEAPRISLPAWALTGQESGAAVWAVDPDTGGVTLRSVSVLRHLNGQAILADGLTDGERVVSRGAHLMFPGRVVSLAEIE